MPRKESYRAIWAANRIKLLSRMPLPVLVVVNVLETVQKILFLEPYVVFLMVYGLGSLPDETTSLRLMVDHYHKTRSM